MTLPREAWDNDEEAEGIDNKGPGRSIKAIAIPDITTPKLLKSKNLTIFFN